MSKSSLQPGTSLGILVGLIFGLVAASLVALYLANTVPPIQTKAQTASAKVEAPQDTSQVPDPNDFLYGKPFKPEVVETPLAQSDDTQQLAKNKKETKLEKNNKSSDMAKEEAALKEDVHAATDSLEEKIAKINNETPAVNKTIVDSKKAEKTEGDQDGIGKIASIVTPDTTTRKTNDKEDEKTVEKSSEKVSSTQSNADSNQKGERYFVQVGAYSSADDAKNMQNKAENYGVMMGISPREKEGMTLHRVRTKPLQPAEAERLRNTLKANGMEAQLVKAQ